MAVDPMTTEVLALITAITLPIVALAAVVGLFTGVRELERSRDELVEVSVPRR